MTRQLLGDDGRHALHTSDSEDALNEEANALLIHPDSIVIGSKDSYFLLSVQENLLVSELFVTFAFEMRILFLTYHGFDPASGITKKMQAQVKGLRQCGHDVHVCYYDFDSRGHRCRFVDQQVIKDYGTGVMAALRQRVSLGSIYKYGVEHGIELVYARSNINASPFLIRLFSRLRRAGVKSVMEIPTYPYDHEFNHHNWDQRLQLRIDQLFRRRLARQMEAIVTFSDEKEIFGQRTIRISNGVDLDVLPLCRLEPSPVPSRGKGTPLHLIGVAEVHTWHGFDRLIAGLGEYYAGNRPSDSPMVYFHIVGGVGSNEMNGTNDAQGFKPLIERYGLQDKVVFHGQLFGQQLNDVFSQCQFAIGSLGRHRSGITHIKTLKNREYASRGIPFIYSEMDSDFDHQPYVMKAPADESPIDINRVVDFVRSHSFRPENIRQTVEHLSWKQQMNIVINSLTPP